MVSTCHQCGADTPHACAKCRLPVCAVCAQHDKVIRREFTEIDLPMLTLTPVTICKDNCRPIRTFAR